MTLKKLANLDSRVVYMAIFISVLLPLFRPLGLKISVSPGTYEVFSLIEALEPGDLVIVSPSFAPSSQAEVYPQMEAMLRHLLARSARICFVNLNVEGSMYAEKVMSALAPEFDLKYGSDYAILPFVPGQETAVASFAKDFRGSFSLDANGSPLTELAVFQDVRSIKDFSLLIDFNTGNTAIYYVQHVQPLGLKVVAGASGVTVPYLTPYLGTGQLAGLIGGLRGAAEYETAIGRPGQALANMDAQSLSHASILVLVAVGNGAYFISKRQEDRSNGGGSK